ncbi:MAG: DegT/DnrJ/EryC1/StrS aminotransferase family protein [Verrucomicrobiota bacterium]|nr:DegT/DnrJ/EryC1/StrS aminotransferase family protein [Verrucomicrobiota bacterium]
MDTIPVFKPLLEREELEAAQAALELGWLGMGEYVGRFEDTLGQAIQADTRHVVALGTGHAALHLGLLLADVGPGDEVITPSFNNIADHQAIWATGARPAFCDILPDTLCIDLDQADRLVTPSVKAVIAMDYACQLCDHERLADFAAAHKLRVVHDAAHSLGSHWRGQPIGSFSDMCMFSFDPIKTITCIDGGALVVRSTEERERLHRLRLIGMGQPAEVMYQNRRAWTYDVVELGYRYHLANLHAALGLEQLSKLDIIASTRRATCRAYNEAFTCLEGLDVPPTDFDGITPFLYYVRVAPDRREDFRGWLEKQGVETGLHWQPGHGFTLFRDCRRGELPVTEQLAREIVTLPLHSCMAEENQGRVIAAVQSFFDQG